MGRTTIVLAVIAACMLAFIVFFERDMITSRETDKRKGHLLQRFVRDRVEKLEIERDGKTIVLVKKVDKDDINELSGWHLKKPWSAEADESIVNSILGDLEWMDPERTLEDIQKKDIATFGLDKPRLRAWFTVGSHRVPIVVGKKDPRGKGYYLQLDDPKTAYIVDSETIDSLNHPPGYFHTKDLHDGVSIYTVQSITVRNSVKPQLVEKRKGAFWLIKPDVRMASYQAVHDLVDKFDKLKATKVVSYDLQQLNKYGLDSPKLSAVVHAYEYDLKTEKKQQTIPFNLEVGSACGSEDDETYVKVGEKGPVVCVTNQDLTDIQKILDKLQADNLLPILETDIEKVRIAEGNKKLELDQKESEWSFKLLDKKAVVASGVANKAAVQEWFSKLKKLRMSSSVPLDQSSVDATGVSKPRITLRFIPSKKEHQLSIRVGNSHGGKVYVQRADEAFASIFDLPSLDLIKPTTIHFRDRQLIDETAEDLQRLEVTRGDTTEKLTKHSAEEWVIDHPVKLEADRIVMTELEQLFSSLETLRFVADVPEAAYGLQEPQMRIFAHYVTSAEHKHDHGHDPVDKAVSKAKQRDYSLKIGASAEGGYYAQLNEDKSVFVVSQVLVEQLQSPLIGRTTISTPIEEIQELKIEKRGQVFQIQHRGEQFTEVDEKIDNSVAKNIAESVAKLRATSISAYGQDVQKGQGASPLVEMTIVQKERASDPKKIKLSITKDLTHKDSENQILVRRSDVPVSFVVPIEQLSVLLDAIK